MEKWEFLTLPAVELRPLDRPTRSQSLSRLLNRNRTMDNVQKVSHCMRSEVSLAVKFGVPSSGVLKEYNVSETESVSILRWKMLDRYQLHSVCSIDSTTIWNWHCSQRKEFHGYTVRSHFMRFWNTAISKMLTKYHFVRRVGKMRFYSYEKTCLELCDVFMQASLA
jgi:hypothetical protein